LLPETTWRHKVASTKSRHRFAAQGRAPPPAQRPPPPPRHKVGTRFWAAGFGKKAFREQPYIYIYEGPDLFGLEKFIRNIFFEISLNFVCF
jgi:hypothetical protein